MTGEQLGILFFALMTLTIVIGFGGAGIIYIISLAKRRHQILWLIYCFGVEAIIQAISFYLLFVKYLPYAEKQFEVYHSGVIVLGLLIVFTPLIYLLGLFLYLVFSPEPKPTLVESKDYIDM